MARSNSHKSAPNSSYAAAAAVATPNPQQERIRKLWQPEPTSFTLIAALQLLSPMTKFGQTVYLMDKAWLENWLCWAFHQEVPPAEMARVREAVRLAALDHGLTLPNDHQSSFDDPGPIDVLALSVTGHELLLSPLVTVHRRPSQQTWLSLSASNSVSSATPSSSGPMVQRIRSYGNSNTQPANNDDRTLVTTIPEHGGDTADGETKKKNLRQIEAVGVPETFYETLRRTHGVLCDDGDSVTFQPSVSERVLLQHHQIVKPKEDDDAGLNEYEEENDEENNPRPVEFRRKVVAQAVLQAELPTNSNNNSNSAPTSLMEKLMLEEVQRRDAYCNAAVEAHPIRLTYCVDHDATKRGFCLVSRETNVVDAIFALLRVAAPNKSSDCMRLWSRRTYASQRPTKAVTEYELVDVEGLRERHIARGGEDPDKRGRTTVQEWVQSHYPLPEQAKQLDVLVETRRNNSDWPRLSLELENRLQIGDFCDAQDVAGKWYEAVVRDLDEETVTVHYMGWASKWDARIKLRNKTPQVKGIPNKVKAPAPLWSRTERWREQLSVGDAVEVRDASSVAERPKWYKGEIKKLGNVNDPVRDLQGGAELELYGDEKPLILLSRTQQVLVEVEQERLNKSGGNNIPPHHSPGEADLAAGLKPEPPYLRWVNLYGEEICKIGTHLEDEQQHGPVTLRYEYEGDRKPVEVLKSNIPALGAGFMRESLRGTPPAPGSVGLHNLGNSCFLNSTVQCLNHIEPLTQYFLQDLYTEDLNRKNPLGSGGNVANAYASLLRKMWGGQYSVLAPRLLKQTVASFAPQFDNCYQHDGQEFCQFLMDGLHEDLNRVKTKPYVEELEGFGMDDQKAAIESWRKHLLRHDSIIVDHCQGMHRSHLTCPRCGRESIKFDVFSSISLPLATNKKRTTIQLEDCLEKFMEGEQLDERNAWYCPSCRRHVCALKMIALWSVPDILILHLKRFTFDTCMTSGSMLRSKMDDTVEFPIEGLDLTKHVLGPKFPETAPATYKLFGISEHAGQTANSGHYTATVRNSIDGQWYRCNDSHVGRTSAEAAMNGGAYLLFYQRTKGSLRWAGMERVMQERNINPYGGLDEGRGFQKVKTKKSKKKDNNHSSSH